MISTSSKSALVIGAGVSGLTTATELVQAGWKVTILAEKPATETVSMIAGALWEWPPAVCGFHSDIQSLERSKSWSATTYHVLSQMSSEPGSGVSMLPSFFYFFKPVAESNFDHGKMLEIKTLVDEFEHDSRFIQENEINPDLNLQDSYVYVAPVVHTRQYLIRMRENLERWGVTFVDRKLSGLLTEQLNLLKEFKAQWLINCTGLGGKDLGDDSMYPLRGALVRMRLENDPTLKKAAHCISHDDSTPQQNMIYVVPRGEHLLLGGIAQPDEWDTNIDLNNSEAVKGILQRCQDFMPRLNRLIIDEDRSAISGLRPARDKNVRLELDSAHPIVHNYGHGGSGFSFSWGCAREVVDLLENA